ncbi:DUF1156 domain-containing protein [Bradyrhizobium betae]|uniref:DUF1156 domain-containing protein n=1 Tax=Bradyrhizobium betae TaxID=244734 RepID=A0A5P6PFU9_9BRAD|nr:DUF1156 domain-containing protein [Bradyrhizobium betae]MCS3726181.1 putative DNA methylase [Bradyrhizobium betae]QFI76744.1 DUF1156 domain-containing protein [Bradyrhizobium betae]
MALAAKDRKKLIEVSIPLEAINAEARRRKQKAPKGYPTSFHKYWAQRPVAACRAVLFSQIVDDPASCIEEFPTIEAQNVERDRLHRLIERMLPWEVSNDEAILSEARYEIARSVARGRSEKLPPLGEMKPQAIIDYLQAHAPPVFDPFSGGASMPLEAQRLGLKAIGSDLNPVAVLIGKALVELPQKFTGRRPINPEVNELHQWRGAQGLAEDVRFYARWMRQEAEKRLEQFYPKVTLEDGKEATVVAWLWARTVRSPDPKAGGAYVPLASTFLLSSKEGREVVAVPQVNRFTQTWTVEINDHPTSEQIKLARSGTKKGSATFACLLTGVPIDGRYIDEEASEGRMRSRLVATVIESRNGRRYVAPTLQHEATAQRAVEFLATSGEAMDIPLQECRGTFGSNAQGRRYGFRRFSDYFSPRQLLAAVTFSDLVMSVRTRVLEDGLACWSDPTIADRRPIAEGGLGPVAYADTIATMMSIVQARMNLYGSSLCKWLTKDNAMASAIAQKGIEMAFDFAEGNPLAKSSADILTCSEAVAGCLELLCPAAPATIEVADAASTNVVDQLIVATDPPYLDNISYADLSDYFYVWHRRSLKSIWPDLFRRLVTPKTEEIVAEKYRHGGEAAAAAFFMAGMKSVLTRLSKTVADDYPLTLFYAYKQSDAEADRQSPTGWSAFLQAVVDANLSIDATWPLRTELTAALKQNVNSLASSIVLVCRLRHLAAPTTTRADYIRALRREMPDALAEIRRGGVAPTDLQQAAIGPGIGIFTRYAQVLNTDGTPMLVSDALRLINQVREEITSTGDADYDNETRFALDWFAAKGFENGRSGDAITMTNAVNVSLDGLNAAGFFSARSGGARLLRRDELPNAWDPALDARATVWEACQHLVKRLTAEDGGVEAAAVLYNRLGALADPAHALARRLYDICEQKQWASEGRVYNQLHQEWAVIEKRAAELADTRTDLFTR